jgi:hypothetical protein
VWHKDNLYLGTSTIGNEKYKDDATKTDVLR